MIIFHHFIIIFFYYSCPVAWYDCWAGVQSFSYFSFQLLVIIFIGAGLLMLPRATYHGISWIDALFTATSATCVTGLVSVDVPSTFTLEGQIIIILLIQIGGLGVMTLTSFLPCFLWEILLYIISW